jgi:hypothetical protein
MRGRASDNRDSACHDDAPEPSHGMGSESNFIISPQTMRNPPQNMQPNDAIRL